MKKDEIKTKIEELRNEVKQLEIKSSDIATLKNQSLMKKISKDLHRKRESLENFEKLQQLYLELSEAKKMEENEKNKEMIEMISDEIQNLQEKKQALLSKLEGSKGRKEDEDINTCIIEIRAGTGGEESSLFSLDLFRMYSQYAKSKNWKIQILSKNETGTGGLKEVIAQIDGENVYNRLKYESGVHRVQRVPVTESSGRIHTSAASVVVYPLIENEETDIDPNDLKIDVFRASGPGGQSVNTTDSAVRITHIPSGLVISCQDEKSQHKNKKKALSILSAKLLDTKKQEQQEEISQVRKTAIKSGDRSVKIRTYNFPQNRVTDHRIKKSWHNLKNIIDGDLDQIIDSLKKME